jgi:hypothetical protein
MKILLLILLIGTLASCAAPRTTVQTDGQEGTVIFKIKPSSSIVYVDGVEVGKARKFSGSSAVLSLPPGSHRIVVKNGDLACEKNIYLSDTQEVIKCNLE